DGAAAGGGQHQQRQPGDEGDDPDPPPELLQRRSAQVHPAEELVKRPSQHGREVILRERQRCLQHPPPVPSTPHPMPGPGDRPSGQRETLPDRHGFRITWEARSTGCSMRTLTLVLALALAPGAVARAQEQAPDAGSPDLFVCANPEACAERHGYGSVCEEGHCQPYQDRTDLFTVIGLKEPSEAPPEPYKPLLSILPVVGSNPTQAPLIRLPPLPPLYLLCPHHTPLSHH